MKLYSNFALVLFLKISVINFDKVETDQFHLQLNKFEIKIKRGHTEMQMRVFMRYLIIILGAHNHMREPS